MTLNEFAVYLKWITLDDVTQFFREAILFYTKPIIFFRNALAKNVNDIIKQLTFYYLILIILAVLIANEEVLFMIRVVIISIFGQLAVDIVPITTGIYLTNRVFKIRKNLPDDISNAIFFLLYCYVFLIPISIIPFAIYIKIQDYSLLLMTTSLTCICFIYKFLLFASVFFTKASRSLMAIVVTFITQNIAALLVMNLLTLDDYNSDKKKRLMTLDPVYEEFNTLLGKSFFLSIDQPILMSELYEGENRSILFSFADGLKNKNTILDSITSDANRSSKMLDNYGKVSASLDKAIDSLKFERNKLLFYKINNYYKSVSEYGLQPRDTASSIYSFRNKYGNYKIYTYLLDDLQKKTMPILVDIHSMQTASEIANKPLDWLVVLYYWPALLIEFHRID